MAGEPFCRSCGRILQTGILKCPDCGAPQGSAVPARKGFSKASAAGFLLIAAFALGMFQGLFIVLEPEIPPNQPAIYGSAFPIKGTVRDESGAALANVNVSFLDTNVLTTANGSYEFLDAPSGVVDLRFHADGYGNTTVRVFLYSPQTIDVTMGPNGQDRVVDHESYKVVSMAFQICGFVLIACGLLALLGGIAAYRRRNWGLALAGAIAALLVSPPVSLALGGIAIYLVARGKTEFNKI